MSTQILSAKEIMTVLKQGLIFLFVICASWMLYLTPVEASLDLGFNDQEKAYLIRLYKDRGYDAQFLEKIFEDQRLIRKKVAVQRNVVNKENKRDYDNFTNSYSIHLAKKFSKRWRSTLNKASKEFGVDKEVIVSILLVETGFGNILGKYPVISVFSSIIVEHNNNKELYDIVEELHEEDAYQLERLAKKAAWAEVELDALLQITQSTDYHPFQLKGSYAGAFGMPQFLPSSFLKWGYDSDKNGSVNLYLEPDAIYSIANYLKSHGWKKGLHKKANLKANKKAVWGYNNSSVYVKTVLKVAKKLRKALKKDQRKAKKQQVAKRSAS